MSQSIISPEIEKVAKKIREYKEEHTVALPEPQVVMTLFTPHELSTTWLNPQEVALVLGAVRGRETSVDYVKRLRLAGRLPGKKVSERAVVYRLIDALLVEHAKPYTNKPSGRRKHSSSSKQTNLSDIA